MTKGVVFLSCLVIVAHLLSFFLEVPVERFYLLAIISMLLAEQT